RHGRRGTRADAERLRVPAAQGPRVRARAVARARDAAPDAARSPPVLPGRDGQLRAEVPDRVADRRVERSPAFRRIRDCARCGGGLYAWRAEHVADRQEETRTRPRGGLTML